MASKLDNVGRVAGVGLLGLGRARRFSPVFLGAAAGVAVSAPALFAISAPKALEVLEGLDFGVGGTLGTLQVAVAAAVLAGLTIAHILVPRAERRSADWLVSGGVLLLPLSAIVLMFPLLRGLMLLIVGLGLGFAAGRWVQVDERAASAVGVP